MACTAYTVFGTKVKYRRLVKASNELAVVTCGIVTNKTVKIKLKIVLLNNLEYNRSLCTACVVAKKITEGNKEVSLVVVGI